MLDTLTLITFKQREVFNCLFYKHPFGISLEIRNVRSHS